MKPAQTKYRLMEDGDYESVVKLLSKLHYPVMATSSPEIVAERDGEIIGFISRGPSVGIEECIVEPIVAPSVFVYVRLIEAMENVLRAFKIPFFVFKVPHELDKYNTFLQKVSNEIVFKYAEDDDYSWYLRRIH